MTKYTGDHNSGLKVTVKNSCSGQQVARRCASEDLAKNIKIEGLSSEEFDVTFSTDRKYQFIVFVSGSYYGNLTSMEVEKTKLIEFAMKFLLQRLTPDSIRHVFDVSLISKQFPEFDSEFKHYIGNEQC